MSENKLKTVIQHNAITNSRHDLKACQLDILYLLLSTIKDDDPLYKEYTLNFADIETLTGRKWNRTEFIKNTSGMGSKMYEIGVPNDIENDYTQLWLFQWITYKKGTTSVTVKLTDKATQFFFHLKNNFTMMELTSILSCDSKYAKRIYAICCQWINTGTKEYAVEDLRKMLMTDESFKQWGQFKEKVLDKAKEEINKSTNINMEYTLRKTSRSFSHVTFKMKRKTAVQQQIDFSLPVEKQTEFSRSVAVLQKETGFKQDMAERIANSISFDQIADYRKRIIARYMKAMNGQLPTIKDIPKYFLAMLKEDGIQIKK